MGLSCRFGVKACMRKLRRSFKTGMGIEYKGKKRWWWPQTQKLDNIGGKAREPGALEDMRKVEGSDVGGRFFPKRTVQSRKGSLQNKGQASSERGGEGREVIVSSRGEPLTLETEERSKSKRLQKRGVGSGREHLGRSGVRGTRRRGQSQTPWFKGKSDLKRRVILCHGFKTKRKEGEEGKGGYL